MQNYNKNPMGIENESMKIIEGVMKDVSFNVEEKLIVKRMIHTTGDFEYRKIIKFNGSFINEALDSLKNGCKIYTDTNMAKMGINKAALEQLGVEVLCYISDEDVAMKAKELKTTRSACALEKAVEHKAELFVIGNAPTALFRLLELVDRKQVSPKAIIGVPVGFVGAAESKELLRKYDIPSISTVGNKGGSNVAASIVNALMYMLVKR